jgi:hypothetical protein
MLLVGFGRQPDRLQCWPARMDRQESLWGVFVVEVEDSDIRRLHIGQCDRAISPMAQYQGHRLPGPVIHVHQTYFHMCTLPLTALVVYVAKHKPKTAPRAGPTRNPAP